MTVPPEPVGPGLVNALSSTVIWLFIPSSGSEFLSANKRRSGQQGHWTADARLTAEWRHRAGWIASGYRNHVRDHPVLDGKPVRIVAHLVMIPRRRSRIDPANWAPTAKPTVDGLVDAGWLADDSAGLVEGPDMRLWNRAARVHGDEGILLEIRHVTQDTDEVEQFVLV